jgi:hypothetical protein
MISGIFSAVFASNKNMFGCGVAIFSGNAIHGGDASFYYRGKYKLEADNQMSGTIEAIKFSPIQNSVFGPAMDRFRLKLTGIVNTQGFELSGPVEGRPDLLITISLKKIDELIEEDR